MKELEESVRKILEKIGEDPDRQGLLNTPQRVARMYKFVTSGYHQNPKEILNNLS